MTSDFEDRLHRADTLRLNLEDEKAQFLSVVHERNAKARVEAARRIDALGNDIRNFLTKKNVPTVELVYTKPTFFGSKLAAACTGWLFDFDTLVTTDGRLVTLSPRYSTPWKSDPYPKVRSGQAYIGRYTKSSPLVISEARPGVADATYVQQHSISTRPIPFPFSNALEWASYYYGESYDPRFGLPGPECAMMVPSDSDKLFICEISTYDGWSARVTSFDKKILEAALKQAQRGGVP